MTFHFSELDEEELSSTRIHKRMSKKYQQLNQLAAQFDCPNCDSPTFFPYGEEKADLRQVRRWLCKQCGLYFGPEGQHWALYDPVVDLTDTPLKVWGCWQLKKDASKFAYLPRDLVAAHNEKLRKEAGLE